MTNYSDNKNPPEGLRERKRKETLKRIADEGMRLFIEKGFEATTLDEIAEAANISRRTFFYYFKSKDDILISMQAVDGGLGEIIASAIKQEPNETPPLDCIRNAVTKIASKYPHEKMVAIDKVMRSSETVLARKQATYIKHEEILYQALCKKWPERNDKMTFRIIAMLTIGAVRISLEKLFQEEGKRPLLELFNEAFDAIEKIN